MASHEDIVMYTDLLRQDRKKWDEKAATLENINGRIPLCMPTGTFDGILPITYVLHAANAVVMRLNALTDQAIRQFHAIGEDLELNATRYDNAEVEIGQHVKDAY